MAKVILKLVPWIIILILGAWIYLSSGSELIETRTGKRETTQSTILREAEKIGKIELVKYNMQQVTQAVKERDTYSFLGFEYKNPLISDSKAMLISRGEAVGCIDLTKIREGDIRSEGDTVYVLLPEPEMCYHKLDLESAELYDLQIRDLTEADRKAFMDELYRNAEEQIKKSALEMGILEETRENAYAMLTPILEGMTGKVVRIRFEMLSPELNKTNEIRR